MAMTMQGEVALPADRATVWAALNDPEVLKACIPGCQELEKISDTEFQATAKVAVGPVKATFKGGVHAHRSRPAERLHDQRRGTGRRCRLGQGRREGAARRRRRAAPSSSTTSRRNVGGKIAQLGGRLINGVAKKYADEFFANFAKILVACRNRRLTGSSVTVP